MSNRILRELVDTIACMADAFDQDFNLPADSGQVLISDPCYVMPDRDRPDNLLPDYMDMVNERFSGQRGQKGSDLVAPFFTWPKLKMVGETFEHPTFLVGNAPDEDIKVLSCTGNYGHVIVILTGEAAEHWANRFPEEDWDEEDPDDEYGDQDIEDTELDDEDKEA